MHKFFSPSLNAYAAQLSPKIACLSLQTGSLMLLLMSLRPKLPSQRSQMASSNLAELPCNLPKPQKLFIWGQRKANGGIGWLFWGTWGHTEITWELTAVTWGLREVTWGLKEVIQRLREVT